MANTRPNRPGDCDLEERKYGAVPKEGLEHAEAEAVAPALDGSMPPPAGAESSMPSGSASAPGRSEDEYYQALYESIEHELVGSRLQVIRMPSGRAKLPDVWQKLHSAVHLAEFRQTVKCHSTRHERVRDRSPVRFSVDLDREKDKEKDGDKGFGFKVRHLPQYDDVLVIYHIEPAGALDSWNSTCASLGRRRCCVHPFAIIVSIHGKQGHTSMLKELRSKDFCRMDVVNPPSVKAVADVCDLLEGADRDECELPTAVDVAFWDDARRQRLEDEKWHEFPYHFNAPLEEEKDREELLGDIGAGAVKQLRRREPDKVGQLASNPFVRRAGSLRPVRSRSLHQEGAAARAGGTERTAGARPARLEPELKLSPEKSARVLMTPHGQGCLPQSFAECALGPCGPRGKAEFSNSERSHLKRVGAGTSL